MNRDAIVSAIRAEEAALRRAGVKSLALVGSSARDSMGVMHLLEDALGQRVDVSRRDTLNPLARERMARDAVGIF